MNIDQKKYGLLSVVPIKTQKYYDHPSEYEPSYPNLVIKELLVAIFVLIVLHVVAIFFNAPLEEIANPELTPSPAKAPWYFLGLQELLHYAPPLIAGVMVPAVMMGGLMVLPFFTGRWVLLPLSAMIASLLAPMFDSVFYQSNGVVSTVIFLLLVLLAFLWIRSKPQLDTLPDVVAKLRNRLFFIFVVYFSTLTMIGTYFRGPEWRWIWPWAEGG